MEEQFRKLHKLGINLDLFYVISFNRSEIRLQGILTKQSFQECKKFVEFKLDDVGEWVEGSSKNLNITLTFN